MVHSQDTLITDSHVTVASVTYLRANYAVPCKTR